MKPGWWKWRESLILCILVRYLPKTSVATFVNSLRGVSSRLLRKDPGSLPLLLGNYLMVAELFCRVLMAKPRLILSSNISSDNRLPTDSSMHVAPYITTLKDDVLRRILIKNATIFSEIISSRKQNRAQSPNVYLYNPLYSVG